MSVVIGPHMRRSCLEGVIQFMIVDRTCNTKRAQPVQTGQFGQNPPADSIAAAMASKRKIETPAAILLPMGNLPACWPPCVNRPQGAPAITQIWKRIVAAMMIVKSEVAIWIMRDLLGMALK